MPKKPIAPDSPHRVAIEDLGGGRHWRIVSVQPARLHRDPSAYPHLRRGRRGIYAWYADSCRARLVASSEAATPASDARGERARAPCCARPARSATALGRRRLGNGTVSQPAEPPARRAYAPRRRPGIDGRRRPGRPHHRPSQGRRRGVILIARSGLLDGQASAETATFPPPDGVAFPPLKILQFCP